MGVALFWGWTSNVYGKRRRRMSTVNLTRALSASLFNSTIEHHFAFTSIDLLFNALNMEQVGVNWQFPSSGINERSLTSHINQLSSHHHALFRLKYVMQVLIWIVMTHYNNQLQTKIRFCFISQTLVASLLRFILWFVDQRTNSKKQADVLNNKVDNTLIIGRDPQL